VLLPAQRALYSLPVSILAFKCVVMGLFLPRTIQQILGKSATISNIVGQHQHTSIIIGLAVEKLPLIVGSILQEVVPITISLSSFELSNVKAAVRFVQDTNTFRFALLNKFYPHLLG
jgi:hypothetical protein